MLCRQGARARRSYDRIMDDTPLTCVRRAIGCSPGHTISARTPGEISACSQPDWHQPSDGGTEGPLFTAGDGRRLDRHGAARIVRRVTRRAGITKNVGPRRGGAAAGRAGDRLPC